MAAAILKKAVDKNQASTDDEAMHNQNRKVILITGCSSGIGRAAVERLTAKGHYVYATARGDESLEEMQTWAASVGQHVKTERLDVEDESSIKHTVDRIYKERSRIDVVINNAGYGQYGAIEEVSDEEFRRQFEVNLLGPLRVARAVIPAMRQARQGRIINVSSLAAHVTMPFMGMYSASKHALEAVSKALRLELAHWNIRVIVVEPGPVSTRFQDNVLMSGRALEGPEASPYAEVLNRAGKARYRLNRRWASPIERVTDCIEHAATARRPRTRYHDSWLARWAPRLLNIIPDRLLDNILLHCCGMHKRG